MTMSQKKISTQERDRTVRRYKGLFERGEEIDHIDKGIELALAADDVERARSVFKRALDYNDECDAIERTLEELAVSGDTRSIIILNNEGAKEFREERATWMRNLEKKIRDHKKKLK